MEAGRRAGNMRLQDNRHGGFYGVIFWHRSRLECIYMRVRGEDRRRGRIVAGQKRPRGRKGFLFNDLRNCCPAIFCN